MLFPAYNISYCRNVEAQMRQNCKTEGSRIFLQKTNTIAKLALLLATIIWGSSFIIMKDALDDMGTFFFTGGTVYGRLYFIGGSVLV